MGFAPISSNACGWVAAYNAFIAAGMFVHPADIVRYIESNDGLILDGIFGTNPAIYGMLFGEYGLESTTTFRSASGLDAMAQSGTTAVLCYLHDSGAHFITIKWNEEKGHYDVWNGPDDNEPFSSIDDFLNTPGKNRAFISLTVIN